MITNKVGRAEAERFPISPGAELPSYRRVSSFRASRKERLDVGAGRGKKGEKIYTDDRGSRRIARARGGGGQGRAKGKDLNGLSQKAFSYSPWQTTMAKWREREHILNRFPSSVPRRIYVARETSAARPRLALYVYTASMLSERTRLFLLGARGGGGSFEFKRFKAISQEGGASDCRPSNTDRPTVSSLPPSRLIPFRLFSSSSLPRSRL